MRRRRILIAVLAVLCISCLPAAADTMDLVVMVDTSTSMLPYFKDLRDFLIQDLLTAKLHQGDTFHLLSFNSTPEEEISLAMGSEEAAQKAFGRLLLLQPFGRYTDLIAALQFLSRYTRELPDISPKTIILVTDGVHDPPPGSPNRGTPDEIRAQIEEIGASIKKEGWTFHILKVPAEPAPGEEGLPSYLSDIAKILDVPILPYTNEDKASVTGKLMGFPTLTFPGDLGKVGRRFGVPFQVGNFSDEPVIVRLSSVMSDGEELLERPASVTVPPRGNRTLDVPINLSASFSAGRYEKVVKLLFKDDIRISPSEGILVFTFTGASGFSFTPHDLLYVLYAVLGAALVFFLIRLFLSMRKRLHEVPVAGTRGKAKEDHRHVRAAAHAEPVREKAVPTETSPVPRAPGKKRVPILTRPSVESLRRSLPRPSAGSPALPPLIEMKVSYQNSRIGFRNIHRIPQGTARTVGGGFSSFLIFLVQIPRGIAEIRNDGDGYTFTPLADKYFPALSGPVKDCLEAEIPLTTPKGVSFTIRFRPWVSPLDEINALMRSIRREGDR